jgi:hypothetical protein
VAFICFLSATPGTQTYAMGAGVADRTFLTQRHLAADELSHICFEISRPNQAAQQNEDLREPMSAERAG